MFVTLVILLAAITIAVPLSRYVGLGSILGYLVAGVAIGPAGLGLVTNVHAIQDVSELGVTMLLFLIGLELRPHRLWLLRKAIFGMGVAQLFPTAALIALGVWLAGYGWADATVLGIGLALSSTAIVLPMLNERNLLPSAAGRDGFAVLLFQDMAAIPALALLPILVGAHVETGISWGALARGVTVIVVILVGGTLAMRPVFRMVASARSPEVFTAASLLLVVGTAALADWAGLSASLGAFMAGVLVSDSEYRHELEADIQPFEGLLLGLFFMSVGMSADVLLAWDHPFVVILLVIALIVVKTAIGFLVGYARRRQLDQAVRFALALPEGSEFGFVLFAAAMAIGALDKTLADMANLVIAFTMMLVPVMFSASERYLIPRLKKQAKPRPFDKIAPSEAAPVIICGLGRFGQIVARVLGMQRIGFVALDKSFSQVEAARRFGRGVHFGDPTRAEVMRAAGAERARVLVLALDDMEASLQVAEMARRQFPHMEIFARARNRRHAHLLMDLGVNAIVRETFHSSLRLTERVLEKLDVPEAQARHAVEFFEAHDERLLEQTHAIAHNEKELAQTMQEASQELRELFEADQDFK